MSGLPSIRAKKFIIHSSSECKIQVVELERPQADGQTEAVQRTVLSSNFSSLANEVAIFQQLSSFPAFFPRLYGYTENRSAGVMELMTEYFPDGDLQKLLMGRKKPFSKDRLYRLTMDLTQALAEMHRLQIAHRNISLAAVQVTAAGYKLAGDFSRAVLFGQGEMQSIATVEKEKTYAMDVLDLGLCFVQFVLVDPQITTYELNSQEVKRKLQHQLAYYHPIFSTVIYGMINSDLRSRWKAAQAYESLSSEVLDTLSNTSLNSEIPTINIPKVVEMVNQPLPNTERSSLNVTMTSPAERELAIHCARLSTLLEVRYLEEALLRNCVTDLLAFFNVNKGNVEVQLHSDLFGCIVCHRDKLIYEKAVLPICGHELCRTCLNSTISESLHTGRYTCPIDNEGFDPFDAQVKTAIEPFVMKKLDVLRLDENFTCQSCNTHYYWEMDLEMEPVNIQCLGCGDVFCSFCKKKAHKYSCDAWQKHLKKRRPKN